MENCSIKAQIKKMLNSERLAQINLLFEEGYKGVFVILRLLNQSQTPLTSGEIAKKMNVTSARISRALNYLEGKNYIIRIKDDKDARKVLVTITSEGRVALKQREKEVHNTIQPCLDNLTREELKQLIELVNKLLGN